MISVILVMFRSIFMLNLSRESVIWAPGFYNFCCLDLLPWGTEWFFSVTFIGLGRSVNSDSRTIIKMQSRCWAKLVKFCFFKGKFKYFPSLLARGFFCCFESVIDWNSGVVLLIDFAIPAFLQPADVFLCISFLAFDRTTWSCSFLVLYNVLKIS